MASVSSEAEPERTPAPRSTTNMAAFSHSATQRMGRELGSEVGGVLLLQPSWQWADIFSPEAEGWHDWKPSSHSKVKPCLTPQPAIVSAKPPACRGRRPPTSAITKRSEERRVGKGGR